MVCSARDFKSALNKKGFILERRTTDEIYFLYYQGKRTSVHTKVSMGKGEDLRDALLTKIRRQLQLDTASQLQDFINCPMTGDAYAQLLVDKQVIEI
jgi:hypothetical protein